MSLSAPDSRGLTVTGDAHHLRQWGPALQWGPLPCPRALPGDPTSTSSVLAEDGVQAEGAAISGANSFSWVSPVYSGHRQVVEFMFALLFLLFNHSVLSDSL